MRPDCLNDNLLVELAEGRLEPGERRRALEHLDGCGVCRGLLVALARGDAADPPAPLRVGAIVGRYVLEELVGAGGAGVVYRAFDPGLSRHVAVKLLQTHRTTEDDDRLLAEAHSLARLSHPNVVAIHDVGSRDGQIFLAMDLGRGSMRGWLAAAPRAPREVLRLLLQAGEGLAAAHATGIVHRDVKPDNVLISADGRALVTDFGLARVGGEPVPVPDDAPVDEANLTATGVLVGTPGYMAPEQLRGAVADEACDQFAFCVTVFEALTGTRPFAATTLAELRDAAEHERWNRAAARHLPGWIRRALRRGLRADPDARWPSLRALLDALGAGPPLARKAVIVGLTVGVAAVFLLASLMWGLVTTGSERARAERRLVDVRRLTTELLFEFETAIEGLPGSLKARKLVVARAGEHLEALAAEARDDLSLKRELGYAFRRLADIEDAANSSLGETEASRTHALRAVALFEEIVTARPADRQAQIDLAKALGKAAEATEDVGRLDRGLGILMRLGPVDEHATSELARLLLAWGPMETRRGNYAAALVPEWHALALYERLAAASPTFERRRNVALACKYLGGLSERLGDLRTAIRLYRRAVTIDGPRVAERPLDIQAKLDLGYSEAGLAQALDTTDQFAESLAVYRRVLSLREAVAAADPDNRRAREAVGRAHLSLAPPLRDLHLPLEALAEADKAAAVFRELHADEWLAQAAFERAVSELDAGAHDPSPEDRRAHLEAAVAAFLDARAQLVDRGAKAPLVGSLLSMRVVVDAELPSARALLAMTPRR